MKKILTLLCLLPMLLTAQTTQKGKTLEYKGKDEKTALAGVQIVAGGTSDISGSDGSFSLVFQKLRKGDRIAVNRIAKSGYVIFNKDALDVWHVSGDDNPFIVVLCKTSEFDDLVATYYDVSFKSYKQQWEDERVKSDSLLRQGAIKEQEYNAMLKESYELYQSSLEQLQEHAEMMARIDMNVLSGIEQQALELAQQGKIDEAVRLMGSIKISEELEKTKNKKAAGLQMVSEAEEDMAALISKANTVIKLYSTQGGKENFDKCCELYKQIALADTTNIGNLNACIAFLSKQNKTSEALVFCDIALRNSRAKALKEPDLYLPDVATSLYQKGVIQTMLKRYPDAEKNLTGALDIYRLLSKNNEEIYMSSLALALNTFGILQRSINRYAESEKSHVEALNIRKQILAANPDVGMSSIAESLNNLGVIQNELNRYAEAEENIMEALRIRRELAAENPDKFLKEYASSLNNLGALQKDLNRYKDAENSYLEALNICLQLIAINPDAYLPLLGDQYNNLGLLQFDIANYEEAKKNHGEALVIRRQLADANPETYLPDLAASLDHYGVVQQCLNNFEDAEKCYIEALSIRRKLAVANPEAYLYHLVISLNNLGAFQQSLNSFEKAEEYYNEALTICKKLASDNPDMFLPIVELLLNNIGLVQFDMANFEDASKNYLEALSIARQLAAENSNPFLMDIALILNDLGNLQRTLAKYSEAAKSYDEIADTYRKLAELDGQDYLKSISESLGHLSECQLFIKKFAEAEQSAAEALKLDSTQTWIKTKLLESQLLQGKYEGAKAIALEIKDLQNTDGQYFRDVILEELASLEKQKVISKKCRKDVESLKNLLKTD